MIGPHLLQYKIEATVPSNMRRSIYRLAAVLEIVDNELENIRDSRNKYQNEMKKLLQDKNSTLSKDESLDNIMLESILDQFFPHENKKEYEPYDDMLAELFKSSIETSGQLEQLLEKKISYIKEKEFKRRGEYGHPFYSYTGLMRIALSGANGEELRKKEDDKNEHSIS